MENEAPENPTSKPDIVVPKAVTINTFPADLYRKIHASYVEWNTDRIPSITFSGYLIYLLSAPDSLTQQLSDKDTRIEEILRENESIQRAFNSFKENEHFVLSEENQTLKDRIAQLESQLQQSQDASTQYFNKVLELELELTQEPEEVPVMAGKFDEKAMMAGLEAVIDKASELTEAGITNRFQTFTKSQYKVLFNQVYSTTKGQQ